MKSKAVIGILLFSTTGHTAVQQYDLQELTDLGVNSSIVADAFKQAHNIEIGTSEKMRVTSDEEGQNLKFDTLDNHSVIVPIEMAAGTENKFIKF